MQHRADSAPVSGLNIPGTFIGTVRNRENTGMTGEELVTKWNHEHTDDPVTIATT